jgi:prepilin-type N-terminal cleavage/methylation domain-containing protein
MLLINNKGFTLIEVLLAVSLLGIALIPIMQLMPGMYRINRVMITENTLSFYAQDKLEEVKSNLVSDFSYYDTHSGELAGQDADNPNYSFDIDINGGTNIRVIILQVWHGGAGSAYNDDDIQDKIELKTKIARRTY